MRIVIDTNVLISGAFFSGAPLQILQACIKGLFDMAISPEILNEYKRVGEEISQTHPNPEFDKLLNLLVEQSYIVDAPELRKPLCRDPHDDMFLACAIAVKADVIVSGDKDLLALSSISNAKIVSPREFINLYLTDEC